MEKEEVRVSVTRFLEMCINYANDSIDRKKNRLTNDKSVDAQKEIEKWISYREFTEHALKEVSLGELDDWLEKIVNENR